MADDPLARSFGRAAADYERGRPEWPAEAVRRSARALRLGRGAHVLDLAAGTGKLTRRLDEHFAHVVAVEPDARMRRLLAATAPAAETLDGAARSIPLGDASVDAVFVADAFHWFATAPVLGEIARVLRPGGGLVLLWKWWGLESFEPRMPQAALARLDAIYEQTGRPGGARYESGAWREPFAASAFEPLGEDRLAHTVELSRAQAVSLWLSVSSVASLPDAERDELARHLHEHLAPLYRLTERIDLYWTRLDVSRPRPPVRTAV